MSGRRQSIPLLVLPDTFIAIRFLHFASFFFVTLYMAYSILIGSLFFPSGPKGIYKVTVPYVIIVTSILYFFSNKSLNSYKVIGPSTSIFYHLVNSILEHKDTFWDSLDRPIHKDIKLFIGDLDWWQGIVEYP